MAATAKAEIPGSAVLLPSESRDAYEDILSRYIDEYRPVTPTERFLVTELAQAQWRLSRADAMEAELLQSGTEAFRGDAVTRLDRYTQSARRAYYKARQTLDALRRERPRRPAPAPVIVAPPPMPVHLARELEAHRRRDPDFDPRMDASQMSKELQKWFQRKAAAA